MLPLPEFELVQAETIDDVVQGLTGPVGSAMILAGGTDLVPNLKHGLHAPKRLVSLRRVRELRDVRQTENGGWFFGAGVTLTELATHPVAQKTYPALADAAGLVAAPQIRNMGTLGGNLCLDTRCVYYNQTLFWRDALGYCLKKDGDVCHVVPAGSRCVASHSADTPGPLITYGGVVNLVSAEGEREVAVADFFRADGIQNTVRQPNELLTGVKLPAPGPGTHAAYEKLRMRGAIDFPALSVAVSAVLEDDGTVKTMALAVSGLGAKPRPIRRVDSEAQGKKLDAELTDRVAKMAYDQCHPMTTINVDSDWRRNVLPVLVRRALGKLKASETS